MRMGRDGQVNPLARTLCTRIFHQLLIENQSDDLSKSITRVLYKQILDKEVHIFYFILPFSIRRLSF